MNWNAEINEMPLGGMVERSVQTKDGVRKYDEYVSENVIVASKCGKVIKSYWLPKEQRWAGLANGEQPIAWMRWPDHPQVSA